MGRACLIQQNAFIFAVMMAAASVFILTGFINVLTAVLTFASMIGYAVVYTMYLKKATPQNIVIGGLAGATPPLLGWTSVKGTQGQVRLEFASKAAAVAYAQREGLGFDLIEPAEAAKKPKTYADNFRNNRKIPWSH